MSIPAWRVVAWAPWFASVAEFEREVRRMRHLGTSVDVPEEGDDMMKGQMLWGSEREGRLVGIAWDWGAATRVGPALRDPMALMSNIHLVGKDGSCLANEERLLHLNGAVNRLRWQRSVPRGSFHALERLAA